MTPIGILVVSIVSLVEDLEDFNLTPISFDKAMHRHGSELGDMDSRKK
jgi:hypothetical protein